MGRIREEVTLGNFLDAENAQIDLPYVYLAYLNRQILLVIPVAPTGDVLDYFL